jgi:hypothetical protein
MRRRSAFTLIEMLVSTALVLFVMVLLTQAFGIGVQVFTQLKGIGDMEDRLRIASAVMRRDLSAYHFDGTRRLSDPTFFQNGPPPQGFFRIWQGSPSLPYTVGGTLYTPPSYEGVDGNGLPSVLTTDRILHFTVQLSGNNPQDFFVTNISSDSPPISTYTGLSSYLLGSTDNTPDTRYQLPGTYASQTIEVAYFLRANGNMTTQGGTPLYTLYRRQLLVVPNNSQFNGTNTFTSLSTRQIGNPANTFDYSILYLPAYAEISAKSNFDTASQPATPYIYFNSPADLTLPERRFGMDPNPTPGVGCWPLCQIVPTNTATWTYPTLAVDPYTVPYYFPPSAANYPPKALNWDSLANADALLEDVLSFDVKIYSSGSFTDVPASNDPTTGTPPGNPLYSTAAGVHVFDTWSNAADPTVTASGATYDYSTAWNDTTSTLPAVQVKRIPLQMTIPAIQITIRLWDKKTQQSRQLSFVQDM